MIVRFVDIDENFTELALNDNLSLTRFVDIGGIVDHHCFSFFHNY